MKKFLLRQRNRFNLLRFSRGILPAGLLLAVLVTTAIMWLQTVHANVLGEEYSLGEFVLFEVVEDIPESYDWIVRHDKP